MKKTLGQLIDELSIVNMKIWACEDIKHNFSNDDKKVADATRKTNKLNPYRNQLIAAIDDIVNEIISGQAEKNTGQSGVKMYGK